MLTPNDRALQIERRSEDYDNIIQLMMDLVAASVKVNEAAIADEQ